MTQKISYYAIVNEFSSREIPSGILRRTENDHSQDDEVFTAKLRWEHTPLLYSAERGNLDNTFVPISEEEAMRLVERIRQHVTDS